MYMRKPREVVTEARVIRTLVCSPCRPRWPGRTPHGALHSRTSHFGRLRRNEGFPNCHSERDEPNTEIAVWGHDRISTRPMFARQIHDNIKAVHQWGLFKCITQRYYRKSQIVLIGFQQNTAGPYLIPPHSLSGREKDKAKFPQQINYKKKWYGRKLYTRILRVTLTNDITGKLEEKNIYIW